MTARHRQSGQSLRALLAAGVAVGLAACQNTPPTYLPSATTTIVPNAVVNVSPNISYTLEEIALAGAAAAILYVVYDPLAPNWRIEEQRIDETTFVYSLQAKSFRIGGDGEAMQILKRRALQLQREKGYAAYRILNYSEGIESGTPFTKRVGEGTIQLVRAGGTTR